VDTKVVGAEQTVLVHEWKDFRGNRISQLLKNKGELEKASFSLLLF